VRLSARLRAPSAPVPRTEEAYTRYLRGRHLWQQRSGASLAGAIAEFEASRTSDPVYANAHLGLAESWLLLPLYAGRAPQETYPRARVAAEEALRLDPSSARAHAVLGVVTSQFDWDWEASDRHFAQAVALNPNDATALQWQAEAQCFRGRFDECAQGLRAARELDPLSPILAAAESFPARFSRDSAAALRILLAVEKAWPDFPFIQYQLGLVYCREEKWDEALRTLEAARPSFGLAIVGGEMANVYARSGRRAEAVRLRDEMLAMSRRAYFPPVTLAAAEIGLGDLDAALAHLERAVEVHDDFLVYLRNEHHVDVLRDTPRFQAILERLGFQTSEQTARHGPPTTAGGAR
jgi:tetratricopeptide (TPR) repeat protein